MKTVATIGAVVLAWSCASLAQDAPAKAQGGVLVGPAGMTLYTYVRDGDGKSSCVQKCAELWPPFKAEGAAASKGDWSVIARDDGSRQWAYKGKPLYYWVKDKKPGDKTGDKVNNTWNVATP
jgi:predicted lipoprotein with Yx(FWY)xxD motif